jgi:hypothetical protein
MVQQAICGTTIWTGQNEKIYIRKVRAGCLYRDTDSGASEEEC